MTLIPMDELQTLKAAKTVKDTAETAAVDQQKQAIAYLINTAANCGQLDVTYNGKILPEVLQALETNKYEVTYDIAVMNAEDIAHISWKNPEE